MASGILCEDLKNARANHQFVRPVRLRSPHVQSVRHEALAARRCQQHCLHEVNERVGTLLDSTLHADEDVAENVSYLILVCCGRIAKTYVRCVQLEFISATTPNDIGELVVSVFRVESGQAVA